MIILVFILGLCVGSFLNCVIYRLEKEESFLKGRSYCPKCHHQLGFFDLIPVFSFIFLKGRCRYCRERISWQYPAVELVTGVLFVLFFLQRGFGTLPPPLPLLGQGGIFSSFIFFCRDWLFIAVLVVIFIYDLKHYLIPDKIVLPAAGLALLINLFLGYSFLKLVLAAAVMSGFFLLQYLVSKGKWIGFGDVKFGLLIGFLLSWPQVILALFFAYLIGAASSVILILLKKKGLKSEVPFGPFLAIATVGTLFWGQTILSLFFVY